MTTFISLGSVIISFFITLSAFNKNECKVNTVDVGISVSDTVRSLAFYTNVLGMKQIGTWHA